MKILTTIESIVDVESGMVAHDLNVAADGVYPPEFVGSVSIGALEAALVAVKERQDELAAANESTEEN